jgi:DNA polymerase-3 subunit alpha
MPFVPLHIRSGYSFLKSGLTIDKIVNSVIKHGYSGAGLVDINVLHGVPDFISKMEKAKKGFIIGLETEIDGFNLSLYALDEKGYNTLSRISTTLSQEESIKGDLALSHSGIIGIVSTNEGAFLNLFNPSDEGFSHKLNELSKLVDSFYLGLDISDEEDKIYADKIRDFAVHHTYLCIAFPKILYVKKEDAIVLEIATAISNDEKITTKSKEGSNYFRTLDEYKLLYERSELDLCSEIISRTKFDFHHKRGELLKFPTENSEELLKKLCDDNLNKLGLNDKPDYALRLIKELNIIIDMGYADYFLIVSDYVQYAKNNGILVGPGRGSASGSLVSYLLNITTIDPLKYGLLFERFLNPARKSMPDIDIDFMDTRRDEVITYLRNKYGKDRVANIVTFTTILARQALRDIGRIYSYDTRSIEILTDRLLTRGLSLRESYKHIEQFRKLVDSDKHYLEIVSLASKIENLPRQTSLHAAGIVLNNSPINNAMPVTVDFEGYYVSQYEMNYLEEQGFLKMDILGLRNLTTISNCVDLINKNHPEVKLNKFDLPFEEQDAIDLIASGRTMGIFQLESSGMKDAIRLLKPNRFEDVVALVALFRPGPMDYIASYARRKNKLEQFTYFSDDLKDILEPTYGIIVYQEQIIQIAEKMAGFSLSDADIFRKAVSKKDIDVLLNERKHFINGAIKNGYSEKVATSVFEMIAKFANYGLNKSHSTSYAAIACQMAFLKVRYPSEFYSSILDTSSSTSDAKFSEYVSEMRSLRINILPPDINRSTASFEIDKKGLLFPLSAIKGISGILVQTILLVRKDGPFIDFFDFVCRMYVHKINESQLIKLIESGSFDSINKSRASLKDSIKIALKYAEVSYNDSDSLTPEMNVLPKPHLINTIDDPLENLEFEYEALGIMLSDNPLKYKRDLLASKNVISLLDASNMFGVHNVGGIIKNVKISNTKNGSQMAFVKIFDETAELEFVVFSDVLSKSFNILKKNSIVVLSIKSEIRNNKKGYVALDISPLEE